jgi:heavy metal translocating P-type ATPase
MTKNVVTSIASGVLLLAGWLLGLVGVPAVVSTVVFWAAILVGGYYFGREALEELVFEREIGIELLMSIAAVVAALMGQPAEGAMLVFLYSISEAAEGYTEEKTRSSVRALMELAPKVALIRRDGREAEIPAEELQVGDVFILKPGQAAPTDGVIVAGESSVNQAPVTGESVPVEKRPGETVYAGSINGQGSLEVQATKRFADNTISRIVQMVEEAQERKGKSQRFVERFGRRYSPAVLLIGFLIAVVPPLFLGMSWEESIGRATVFIVAAAPCALVISIPVALAASLGTAARQGVLIKGGIYVEELNRVKVVALDKTGTLTSGRPEVSDVLALADGSLSEREVLALAAGIEERSEHPLARAILRYSEGQDIEPVVTSSFVALAGAGGKARRNGSSVWAGSPELFEEELGLDLGPAVPAIGELESEGKTVVLVGDEEAVWGLIAIRDNLRHNASRAVAGLRAAGINKTIMLTGDNERAARTIAREAGVDEFYAGLKPADKVAQVREFARRYGHVAMVGDGVNDAPAMAEATVGVAMGAAGTDVALETADVALMADDLEKLVYALKLAGRNRRIVMQNLVLSILIISVLSLGALSGALSLPAAVLAHEISELVVIANSLRLLRA